MHITSSSDTSVDNGVRGDHADDRDREQRALPPPHAAHEQDPGRDEQNRPPASASFRHRHHHGSDEHEYRRQSARDRIDDRQLGVRLRETRAARSTGAAAASCDENGQTSLSNAERDRNGAPRRPNEHSAARNRLSRGRLQQEFQPA